MNKNQIANSKFFYLFFVGMLGNFAMLFINSCVVTIPHIVAIPLLLLCVGVMLAGFALAYKDIQKKEAANNAN